jgi:hypothetical protein
VWNIASIPQPPAAGTYARSRAINLYRTVTGETGVTDFYRVASLGIGTTTYMRRRAGYEPATTSCRATNYALPPAGVQGLALMPNGIFVTWKDNNLYFSENFRPHAWPAEYTLTVDYPIVGCRRVWEQPCGLHDWQPVYCLGRERRAMTLQKTDAPLPCLSRRSIVAGAEGVFYASEEGLVLVSPGGVQNVTKDLISREQWRNEYVPSTQKAMYMGGEYIAARTLGGVQSVFRFVPSNPSLQGVSSDTTTALNFGVEPWTGKPWMIGTDNVLYEWEQPKWATRATRGSRGSSFTLSRPTSPSSKLISTIALEDCCTSKCGLPYGVTPAQRAAYLCMTRILRRLVER